jgi:hypothetical protein
MQLQHIYLCRKQISSPSYTTIYDLIIYHQITESFMHMIKLS